MKHYQHLSKEERFYIWNALRTGSSQLEVANALGRSPATVCREIKRNKHRSAKTYTYDLAVQIVRRRRQRSARYKRRKLNEENKRLIEKLISQYLSPDQVSGYLLEHHNITLSHETIIATSTPIKSAIKDSDPSFAKAINNVESHMVRVLEHQRYPTVYRLQNANRSSKKKAESAIGNAIQ